MSCLKCYHQCEVAELKIDRLIGILSVLLQRDRVTAPELAAQFEVSRRTIARDVEDLCRAGIPIATRQGVGGGISIMEGYRVDRALLTRGEMWDILAGLRSLDSVNGTGRYGQLMEKLSAGASDFMRGDQSVLIDLSSWYGATLAPKIDRLRAAIEGGRMVQFHYFAPGGESVREIEPYYLIFRWSSWYVWGWCCARQDFRLFKLNRMTGLQLSERGFERRSAPLPDLRNERIFPGGIRAKVLFEPDCKWRLVEEFGAESFREQADGRLLFEADYTRPDELIQWVLSFLDRAELLEPAELRDALCAATGRMQQRYAREGACTPPPDGGGEFPRAGAEGGRPRSRQSDLEVEP